MGRVHRYVLSEILIPLGLGLVLFGVVVVFGELLKIGDAVSGFGLGPTDFGRAVLFSLPPLLGLLLPIAALFATLFAMARLASAGEVTALTAAGMSPLRLLVVPGALGLGLGLVSAAFLLLGEPWGLRGVENILAEGAQRTIASGIRPGEINQWTPELSLVAGGRDGVRLRGVMLADRRKAERPVVVAAQEAQVLAGESPSELVLELHEGSVLYYEPGALEQRRISFSRGHYRIDVGEMVEGRLFNVTRAQGMYPGELLTGMRTESRARRRALYEVTLHRKVAVPVATVIFCLLAVPLGCGRRGRRRGMGFLYGSGIIAAYYYLGRGFELSARAGGLDATLAAWLPNLIGAATLVVVLRYFARSST